MKKRIISIVLAVLLVLSAVTVFAADSDTQPEQSFHDVHSEMTSVSADTVLFTELEQDYVSLQNEVLSALKDNSNREETRMEWNMMLLIYPDADRGNVPCMTGMTWYQYVMHMFRRGYLVIPFGVDGWEIPSDSLKTRTMQPGEHTAVYVSGTGIPFGLYDVVLGTAGTIIDDTSSPTPSPAPTSAPTAPPTLTPNPTPSATVQPTLKPTPVPTATPTPTQTSLPTTEPSPEPTETPAQTATPESSVSPAPEYTGNETLLIAALRPNSGMIFRESQSGMPILCGVEAARTETCTRVEDLLKAFDVGDSYEIVISDENPNDIRGPREHVRSGDFIRLELTGTDSEGREFRASVDGMYPISVRGDVIGSGVFGLSQLVNMAKIYTYGVGNMEEPYILSADLNADGSFTLSDLVAGAEWAKAPHPYH